MKMEEFTKLKAKIDHLRRRRDRAEGAVEQSVERMRREMGVSTVEEAGTVFAGLEKKADAAKKLYEGAFEAFMEEWGERLGE